LSEQTALTINVVLSRISAVSSLAEFQPKLLLSRPEIYFKPAWGSTHQ